MVLCNVTMLTNFYRFPTLLSVCVASQRRVPHELVGRLLIVMIACSSNIMNSRELHLQLTLNLSLPAKILMSHDESFC